MRVGTAWTRQPSRTIEFSIALREIIGAVARPKRTLLSWSSGKDSCMALAQLRADPRFEVVGLLTTVNQAADRVVMHAVRRTLLCAQAEVLGLPLAIVELPHPCSNDAYQRRLGAFVEEARGDGVEAIAFGDLFLADVRAFREAQLRGSGIEPVFPLWAQWGTDTAAFAERMLAEGVVATVTCVDPRRLDPGFAGRRWDRALLESLPEGVDPCGEHGEFHTFVSDGPGFRAPLHVDVGEVVERDGFVFADLLPAAPT